MASISAKKFDICNPKVFDKFVPSGTLIERQDYYLGVQLFKNRYLLIISGQVNLIFKGHVSENSPVCPVLYNFFK